MKKDLVDALTAASNAPGTQLAHAALVIASIEYPRLVPEPYLRQLDAMGAAAAKFVRQRVQDTCFEKFMVLTPPRTLLSLFSEAVEPVFQQIKVLHAQNQKLRAARDLLLPRLMSGEIAV